MRRTRKISGFETTAVDRISEFPDSVLVHILSFLEIEDAVRTQVLSKRWQFLWTFLPSLIFRYYGFDDDGYHDDDDEGEDFIFARNSDFVTFVGKTLFSSDCKLKKFEVDFEYDPRFASYVDSWTQFTAGKGVDNTLSLDRGLITERDRNLQDRFKLLEQQLQNRLNSSDLGVLPPRRSF